MSPDKLVYMANQIARFFAHEGAGQAPASIEDHLRKFWTPDMRATLVRYQGEGGAGMDPLVAAAVERLTPH